MLQGLAISAIKIIDGLHTHCCVTRDQSLAFCASLFVCFFFSNSSAVPVTGSIVYKTNENEIAQAESAHVEVVHRK